MQQKDKISFYHREQFLQKKNGPVVVVLQPMAVSCLMKVIPWNKCTFYLINGKSKVCDDGISKFGFELSVRKALFKDSIAI